MKTKLSENSGKSENAIIVQGVVLTDTAIEMLQGFQEDDNNLIKADRDSLGDAICNMLQLLDASDQESFKEKINATVIALTYVREHLEDLQKP